MTSVPPWKRVLVGLVALSALACFLLWLGPSPTRPAGVPPAAVLSPPPALPSAPHEDPGFIGVLVASEAVTLAAGQTGPLSALAVKVGDSVEAGALLATVDSASLEREVEIAQARLRSAKAAAQRARLERRLAADQRARGQRLAEHLSAAEQEESGYRLRLAGSAARAAAARVEEETAHLEQLRERLGQADLRAPFSGRVAEVFADRGAWLETGKPLLRLVGASGLRVRFALPEAKDAQDLVGASVAVQLEGTSTVLQGRVSAVSPEVDLGAQMVTAEAVLDEPSAAHVTAGQAARVRLVGSAQASLEPAERITGRP